AAGVDIDCGVSGLAYETVREHAGHTTERPVRGRRWIETRCVEVGWKANVLPDTKRGRAEIQPLHVPRLWSHAKKTREGTSFPRVLRERHTSAGDHHDRRDCEDSQCDARSAPVGQRHGRLRNEDRVTRLQLDVLGELLSGHDVLVVELVRSLASV